MDLGKHSVWRPKDWRGTPEEIRDPSIKRILWSSRCRVIQDMCWRLVEKKPVPGARELACWQMGTQMSWIDTVHVPMHIYRMFLEDVISFTQPKVEIKFPEE